MPACCEDSVLSIRVKDKATNCPNSYITENKCEQKKSRHDKGAKLFINQCACITHKTNYMAKVLPLHQIPQRPQDLQDLQMGPT